VIVPSAKALYLCDGTIGFPGGKTDLMGLFNSIKAASFPHVAKDFVVFAQLTHGLGQVPFYIDIRLPATNQLLYTSNVHHAHFPNRDMTVHLAHTVPGCRFPHAGLYATTARTDRAQGTASCPAQDLTPAQQVEHFGKSRSRPERRVCKLGARCQSCSLMM
jgi:hypothetical protein